MSTLTSTIVQKKTTLKFSSYLLAEEYLAEKTRIGYLRNLEVNRRFLVPTLTNIRMLISSSDVLHSWTIPSFGVKVDACPGRLNEVHIVVKRIGMFFGQCSEICGVNHGFMPTTAVAIDSLMYSYRVTKNFI